jgi:hypothetical protein
MTAHPWLEDIQQDRGELLSDSDPRQHGVVELGDGSVHHVPAAGSLAEQLGLRHIQLTTARSSGSLATRNAQAYGSYGAAPEGPRERTKVRI